MRAARKGQVLVVTSLLGFQGFPFTDAYTASKFALEGEPPHLSLTESMMQVAFQDVPFHKRLTCLQEVLWRVSSGMITHALCSVRLEQCRVDRSTFGSEEHTAARALREGHAQTSNCLWVLRLRLCYGVV